MLIAVIGLISSTGFYIFNRSLSEKIYETSDENTRNIMSLLEDQFYFTVQFHNGKIIRELLTRLEKNDRVLKTYLLNNDNKIIHPEELRDSSVNILLNNKQKILNDSIQLERVVDHKVPSIMAFMNLPNTGDCNRCHDTSIKSLGHIVMDLSLKDTEDHVKFTRKFSIVFTVVLFAIIFLLVLIMHNKVIGKSIKEFSIIIAKVNGGNLNARFRLSKSKELGTLGSNFNTMLDTFQQSQNEITALHKKEMETTKKLATIGEMSARLAHEIRNPITGISNSIEILCNEMQNECESKHIMEEVKKQADRVNNAVSDLLRFSRSQDLKLDLSSINNVIEQQINFIKNLTHPKEIEFILELAEDIPDFYFDSGLMENVFQNLFMNAVNAIKETGILKVVTLLKKEENKIHIAVIDNGEGIDSNTISKIFKPFFTTKSTGTGLGLAIVNDIIEKHKGSIWVESTLETGTTFHLEIPVIQN